MIIYFGFVTTNDTFHTQSSDPLSMKTLSIAAFSTIVNAIIFMAVFLHYGKCYFYDIKVKIVETFFFHSSHFVVVGSQKSEKECNIGPP